LTPKGKDLATLMTALQQWGDRWIYGEGASHCSSSTTRAVLSLAQ
jgi:DNA-binding HxlR family transcriptional regulator